MEQLGLRLGSANPGADPTTNVRRPNLYFAILPDPAAAARMAELGRMLQRRHDLAGAARPPGLLHVSVFGLGDDPRDREGLLAFASRMGDRVEAAAFEMAFTRAVSFRGGSTRPLVLCCSDGAAAALSGLRDQLADAWEALGEGPARRRAYAPHLTLAYDRGGIPNTELAQPVRWPARELVLVRSGPEPGKFDRLASWTLGDRSEMMRSHPAVVALPRPVA